MRALALIASLTLTGCGRSRDAGNDVDLNAAAAAAQDDIATYAASHHRRVTVPNADRSRTKP